MKARDTNPDLLQNIGGLTEIKSGQSAPHSESKSFMQSLKDEINEGGEFVGIMAGLPIGTILGLAASAAIALNPDPNMHIGILGSAAITGSSTVAGGIGLGIVGGVVSGLSEIAKKLGLTKKNLFTDNEKYMTKKAVIKRAMHINDIRTAKDNLQRIINQPKT